MKRNSSLNLPIPLLSCFLPLPKSKFLFGIILLLHVEFLLTSPKVQVYKWLIPVLLVSNHLNFSWTFEHSIPGKRIVGRHFVFCLFVFLVLQRYCSIVFESSLYMMRSLLKFFSLMDTALLPLATFNVFFLHYYFLKEFDYNISLCDLLYVFLLGFIEVIFEFVLTKYF